MEKSFRLPLLTAGIPTAQENTYTRDQLKIMVEEYNGPRFGGVMSADQPTLPAFPFRNVPIEKATHVVNKLELYGNVLMAVGEYTDYGMRLLSHIPDHLKKLSATTLWSADKSRPVTVVATDFIVKLRPDVDPRNAPEEGIQE